MKCISCGKDVGACGIVFCEECWKDMHLGELLKDHLNPHSIIIIDGILYIDKGYVENPRSRVLPYGGKVFRILMNDGTLVTTNNMYRLTHISMPEEYKGILRDNAKFI